MEPSVELSQEDGPSVIALSVLSTHSHLEAIEEDPKPHRNRLDLNDRNQRLIVFNLTMFIWSSFHLIEYLDVVYAADRRLLHRQLNELNLSCFCMISAASAALLIIKGIELKKWIDPQNIDCVHFIRFIHNLVGLVYFVTFFIVIGITWRRCDLYCSDLQCNLMFISSGWFELYISWTMSWDTISTKKRNIGSRGQFIVFLMGTTMHSIAFLITPHRDESQYPLGIIGEVGWWTLSISYFIVLISDCFTPKRLKHRIHCILSILMVTASILAANRIGFEVDGDQFVDESWFLIMSFTIFLAIGLHSKTKQRRRPNLGERVPSKMSIADAAAFEDQMEGTFDVDPLLFSVKQKALKARASPSNHVFSLNSKVHRIGIYSILLFVSSIDGVIVFRDDVLHIVSTSLMLFVSLMMMFVIIQKSIKWNQSLFFGLCSMVQIGSIIIMAINHNGEQIMSIIGSQCLSVMIPLIVSLDIVWSILDEIRCRVMVHSIFLAVSSLFYFIGYSDDLRNEFNGDIPWYIRLSEFGWATNLALFGLLCVIMCVRGLLGVRLMKCDGIFLFIVGVGNVLSLGFSLSFPFGRYPIDNVSEDRESFILYYDALILIPLCCLNSYEMQLL